MEASVSTLYMTTIYHLPSYLTEQVTFMTDEAEVFKAGQAAMRAINADSWYIPGLNYLIELTPPAYPLPLAFFGGFFQKLLQEHGVGALDHFAARCADTKISHAHQYGLTAYKKAIDHAAQTQPIQSVTN